MSAEVALGLSVASLLLAAVVGGVRLLIVRRERKPSREAELNIAAIDRAEKRGR